MTVQSVTFNNHIQIVVKKKSQILTLARYLYHICQCTARLAIYNKLTQEKQ